MRSRYRVLAHNTARHSENKIHDDDVARRFGFRGGLVPGVDVYAYMVHPVVEQWSRDWLEHGTAEIRLAKPVHDGKTADVLAAERDGHLALRVESEGMTCATGFAALAAGPVAAANSFSAPPPPPEDERPPADEDTLSVGTTLAMRPLALTAEFASDFLRDVRETDPIYARERLAHPGMILRAANWVLGHNVVLGPWMHVGSTVRHLGLAHIGEEIGAHARVTANYERKGHRFVELDVAVFAAKERPVARIAHIAIYRPRQRDA